MSLNANDTFEVNRGSDLEFTFVWPGGLTSPLDLTGYTVDGYEVDPALAPYLSMAIEGAPTQGRIKVTVQWNEAMESHRAMGFRVRIARDQINSTTNLLKVVYQ